MDKEGASVGELDAERGPVVQSDANAPDAYGRDPLKEGGVFQLLRKFDEASITGAPVLARVRARVRQMRH